MNIGDVEGLASAGGVPLHLHLKWSNRCYLYGPMNQLWPYGIFPYGRQDGVNVLIVSLHYNFVLEKYARNKTGHYDRVCDTTNVSSFQVFFWIISFLYFAPWYNNFPLENRIQLFDMVVVWINRWAKSISFPKAISQVPQSIVSQSFIMWYLMAITMFAKYYDGHNPC